MTRRPLFLDGSFVTVPVPAEVQKALAAAVRAHEAAFDAVLAPWGLVAANICMPAFERVVYEDESPPASPSAVPTEER